MYDALAKSVDGPLLSELYLQVRRGLEMQEQGGAVSRVREVKIVSGQKEPARSAAMSDPRSFGYRCRWTVAGTVEHWGHVHARTNEYEARFTIEPRANAWKITAVLMERQFGRRADRTQAAEASRRPSGPFVIAWAAGSPATASDRGQLLSLQPLGLQFAEGVDDRSPAGSPALASLLSFFLTTSSKPSWTFLKVLSDTK